MVNQEKKENRGGRRKGSGRPKGTGKLYAFRADKEVATYIDEQENKTEFIRDCIFQQMQLREVESEDKELRQHSEIIPANRE